MKYIVVEIEQVSMRFADTTTTVFQNIVGVFDTQELAYEFICYAKEQGKENLCCYKVLTDDDDMFLENVKWKIKIVVIKDSSNNDILSLWTIDAFIKEVNSAYYDYYNVKNHYDNVHIEDAINFYKNISDDVEIELMDVENE